MKTIKEIKAHIAKMPAKKRAMLEDLATAEDMTGADLTGVTPSETIKENSDV